MNNYIWRLATQRYMDKVVATMDYVWIHRCHSVEKNFKVKFFFQLDLLDLQVTVGKWSPQSFFYFFSFFSLGVLEQQFSTLHDKSTTARGCLI